MKAGSGKGTSALLLLRTDPPGEGNAQLDQSDLLFACLILSSKYCHQPHPSTSI